MPITKASTIRIATAPAIIRFVLFLSRLIKITSDYTITILIICVGEKLKKLQSVKHFFHGDGLECIERSKFSRGVFLTVNFT